MYRFLLASAASCQLPKRQDEKRIRDEIGDETEAHHACLLLPLSGFPVLLLAAPQQAVDYAIHVLLTAGMSTPTLREMARAGVSIEEAGCAEIALPFLFLAAFHFLSILQLVVDWLFLKSAVWQYWLWPGIPILFRTAVIIMLWRSPTDEQCFICKMVAKVWANCRPILTTSNQVTLTFENIPTQDLILNLEFYDKTTQSPLLLGTCQYSP